MRISQQVRLRFNQVCDKCPALIPKHVFNSVTTQSTHLYANSILNAALLAKLIITHQQLVMKMFRETFQCPCRHWFMKFNQAIEAWERLYSNPAKCQVWMWIKQMWAHSLYQKKLMMIRCGCMCGGGIVSSFLFRNTVSKFFPLMSF